jgi:FPC/CPF motif-containing protein YcgG
LRLLSAIADDPNQASIKSLAEATALGEFPVHPKLAEFGKVVDWKKYQLRHFQSEMRTEYKKLAFE